MKRAGNYVRVIVLVAIVGVILALSYNSRKPEFEIQSTIKNTFDNYETVDISVIVHVRDYETDELMEQVRDYYSEVNEMPDELSIRLYNSEKEYKSGTVFSQKLYLKELE